MNPDPLAWLFGLEQFGIKLGLDNITTLLAELGNPERTFRSIHVAGTNGKGSVTAMVDAGLRAAGYRSARYTSPHLIDITERFVVDGHPVDRASLIAAVGDIRGIVARRPDRWQAAPPTFFEVTTATAFELFRRARVETAVCEVGLGGRLDATSVLQPEACAITSIGLDHQQYLGASLREIAIEKAGILKPGVPVVLGPLPHEARNAVEAVAAERKTPVIQALEGSETTLLERQIGSEPNHRAGSRIRLRTPRRTYDALTVGLAGAHQIDNAIVSVRLLEVLGDRGFDVSPSAIDKGLRGVTWPGRLDERHLPDGRSLLLDAAHNVDGAAALASFLSKAGGAKPPLVFAAMRDKDTDQMLRTLAPVVSALILTRVSNSRSADPAHLAERASIVAPFVPLVIEPSPPDALAAAWRMAPGIVVAGSIFLLGEVMKELGLS